jgi:hypothetical protein
MMERIFSTQDNSGRGSEFVTEWRRRGRAAHPDALPSYFQFAVDADQPAVARSPRMAGVAEPRRSRQAENDPQLPVALSGVQRRLTEWSGHPRQLSGTAVRRPLLTLGMAAFYVSNVADC